MQIDSSFQKCFQITSESNDRSSSIGRHEERVCRVTGISHCILTDSPYLTVNIWAVTMLNEGLYFQL
jgi:hypothetical protein